ncbi:MAG: hypothetical protein JXB03_11605 [Spirochaetales bacterium]|nr:hypothetical protein [Spirochaetales bacterium]
MESITNKITITYSDAAVNELLRGIPLTECGQRPSFNQNEEMFVKLPNPVEICSFPVHHDIRTPRPGKDYMKAIQSIITGLSRQVPGLLADLQYYFDPAEVLHPCFFRVFRVKESTYLYLLRLDLSFRNYYSTMLRAGSNDSTPAYRTGYVFFEADIIPLSEAHSQGNRFTDFYVDQIVSQNWIGETGRGYMVQGIWIDHELTKFFSKLFTPENLRIYPYYPFSCKYRTLCHSLLDIGPEGRKTGVPRLHRALETVRPWMDFIQRLLKTRPFDPDMKEFKTLKSSVPLYWQNIWDSFTFKAYLNEADMKEFSLVN